MSNILYLPTFRKGGSECGAKGKGVELIRHPFLIVTVLPALVYTDVSVVWETLQTDFIMPGMQFEYDEEGGTFFYFLFSLWGLVLIPTTYYFWPRKPVDGKDIACCRLVLLHSCSCVHSSIWMIFWLKC